MARRRNIPAVDPVPGLYIAQVKRFTRSVARELQKSLAVQFVKDVVQTRPGKVSCFFTTVQNIVLNDEVLVIPLFDSETLSYWIGLALDFEHTSGSGTYLRHSSLKLYRGVAVDSAELCFRGEWDGRPEASGHAQPHWNIDLFQPGAEINDLEMSGQGFSWNGISDKTKTVATQDAFNYFHFAMASNWQTKDGWHSQVLKEEEEFLRWSSGCASYIKAQLRAQISAQ